MTRERLANRVIYAALLGAIASAFPGSALAQNWTAVRLHTDPMYSSSAYGTDGSLVGGSAIVGDLTKPVLWNLATSTWSDLTPAGFDGGGARATFAGKQAGSLGTFQTRHAALWSGTVGSFLDLHPTSNPYLSEVQAMDAQQQAGYYTPTAFVRNRAALWTGAAATFVSLHPTGAYNSEARGVSNGQQGGFYRQTEASAYHAALWSGTAQSMQDLHPAGAIESQIFGMASGQQVGWSRAPVTRAAMWHGTAQSYIDMGPPGSGFSLINATCGSAQAGYANFAGSISAVVWFGSPTDFVRLDTFMPPGYGQSIATSVSEVNGLFYVGGYATNGSTNRDEAFVWAGVPAPSGLVAMGAGLIPALRRKRR